MSVGTWRTALLAALASLVGVEAAGCSWIIGVSEDPSVVETADATNDASDVALDSADARDSMAIDADPADARDEPPDDAAPEE